MAEAREVVDTDSGAGGYMDAINGLAWGGDDTVEGAGDGRVETERFGNDGLEVFEVVGAGDCDLFFGRERGANFVDEF